MLRVAVAAVFEVVPALRLRERIELVAAGLPQRIQGPACSAFEKPLQLREDQLDRIEVRAVRRQVKNPCSYGRNCFANASNFMDTKIVHHDDVAGFERADEV